jgi:hypothetical protein
LINIVEAQGGIISGFTVQNSPIDGIVGRRGAVVEVRDATLQNHGDGFESIDGKTGWLDFPILLPVVYYLYENKSLIGFPYNGRISRAQRALLDTPVK